MPTCYDSYACGGRVDTLKKCSALSRRYRGDQWVILEHNGRDPSVSKTNLVTVAIFRFSFIRLRSIFLNYSIWIGNVPKVLNLNRLFFKLNQFICN